MFGIMIGKYFVGGYSPVHDLVTYVGKGQAKRFQSQEDVNEFIDTHEIMDYEIVNF